MNIKYICHWVGENGELRITSGKLDGDQIRDVIERAECPKSIDHIKMELDDFEIESIEPC